MRKKIAAACCLATVLSTTAWAADYTFEGPDGGLFARPTSDETIYVDQKEVNVDRSKNTALVPPRLRREKQKQPLISLLSSAARLYPAIPCSYTSTWT